jgi:hypothetical protein
VPGHSSIVHNPYRSNQIETKKRVSGKVRKKAGIAPTPAHGSRLQIFQWIPPGRKNIPLDIHPERQDEINNQRRPHSEERDVDKPGPDTGSGYTHSLTDRRTHSENLPLDEVLESVHVANLKKIVKISPIKSGRRT